jgi:hypothetical protein
MIDALKEDWYVDASILTNPKARFLGPKLWEKITKWDLSETTDLIVRKAIVADVLLITMFELQTATKFTWSVEALLEYVPKGFHPKVREQLEHDEISELFELDWMSLAHIEIRIVGDYPTLQNAMEYCGVFYEGFTKPINPPVPRRDYDEPRSLLMEVVEAAMVVPLSQLKH